MRASLKCRFLGRTSWGADSLGKRRTRQGQPDRNSEYMPYLVMPNRFGTAGYRRPWGDEYNVRDGKTGLWKLAHSDNIATAPFNRRSNLLNGYPHNSGSETGCEQEPSIASICVTVRFRTSKLSPHWLLYKTSIELA